MAARVGLCQRMTNRIYRIFENERFKNIQGTLNIEKDQQMGNAENRSSEKPIEQC